MMLLERFINNPLPYILKIVIKLGFLLSDVIYIKIVYYLTMRKKLDLNNPRMFSEKIQWLKLFDHRKEYITMVDKIAVKTYVSSVIGERYIIPTLGVWDRPEDIDWNVLPDKFVLKTTHGGGNIGVIICKDKKSLDRQKVIEKLNISLKQNIFQSLREWPYKNVPRRILAEQYVEPDTKDSDLPDYKWFCFNGEPLYCQVIQNRSFKETIDFFDTEWNHQEFVGLSSVSGFKARCAAVSPTKPANLEKQIRIARELSKNIPFARIDLYQTKSEIFFGEITFYPKSGLGYFTPNQYNYLLGDKLILPERKKDNIEL